MSSLQPVRALPLCTVRHVRYGAQAGRDLLTLALLVVWAGVEARPDIIVLRHILNSDLGPQLVPAKPINLYKALPEDQV